MWSTYPWAGREACGPNEAVVFQQPRECWVLYAKAGQIFLNVTGQIEARLAAGSRGRGIWRTDAVLPCLDMVRRVGWD